jgi:hypothetical protein
MKNKRMLIISGVAAIALAIGVAIHVRKALATPVPPSISGVTGNTWSFNCPGSFNGDLEVPYSGRSDSNVRAITVTGTNLQQVTSAAISAPGYTIAIADKSPTRITLDIRASSLSESTRPAANPTLTFSYPGGVLRRQIGGIIPSLSVGNLDWGQCTWFAGGIARLLSGRSMIKSYSQGTPISPQPGTAGFPQPGSVLMRYEKHMAFLDSSNVVSRVTNRDGSVTIKYQLNGRQYNARCDAAPSSFSTTMTILQSRSGQYSFVQKPVVVYEIDRVAH